MMKITKKTVKQTYIAGTAPKAEPAPKLPPLVCIRECDIPGVGAWKAGQAVEHPDHLKLLAGHPYFTKSEE